jgi:transcriptional antiterminator RfaH
LLRWYLIYTKPLGEDVARLNLERQGYEVYFPRVEGRRRRHTRWSNNVVPLFPRYLFLRLDEGRQPLGPVRSSVGVAKIVRNGSAYAIVPDELIRDLQARADDSTGLHLLNRPHLATGTPVTVLMPPFDGLQGIFERELGADRVMVLITLLGHQARLRVPLEFVGPAEAA